ncbi:unnamed protein product [Urochloa decumbens]|uniref:AAA+ ATPase domain-containing protein n=1 Tax=Urochloa decumbens TaxID=240449 RepID=A0ABC9FL97_9POAL
MEGAMVSVATGAMSSALAKLGELLHNKYKLVTGVRKDIEFLRSELSFMNGMLCTLADVEDLDPVNKEWRDRVRELAYDIEDCIDLSVARLDRASGDASQSGFFANMAQMLKMTRESLQVARRIKELKARVIEESKRHKRYKLDGPVGSSSSASANKVDLRMCALWEETENLVGLDGSIDDIIRLVMPAEGEDEPSQQVRTVSIVGCAGSGKTTLANQVYQKIQGQFKCKAFVSVSQDPHMKDVLMKICSQVGATVDMADDEQILVNKLREQLQHKRYIVVVDDIWDSDPWKIIGKALVKTSPGSIIIVTTRVKDVAESCCYSHGGRVYDMEPLDDDNSRRLFFKRIFDSEEKCPQELERASEDILKKCDGIPLAIISIASFLAVNVPQSPDHWNKVKESISSPPSRHSKVRRLSLQNSYQENAVSWIKSIKPHVRSLACFVDCCKELHPLTEFEVVRVLDLENCESLRNIHLANIEVLLQLRYLNISRTSVSELPAGIGQLQHLETLDIRGSKVETLPSTIVLLEKLACLFVSWKVQFPAEGFSKMKGLEQLIYFSIHGQPLGFLKELGQLTNLRILGVFCVGVNYDGSEWGIFTSSLHAQCSHKLLDVKLLDETDSTPIPMDSSFPAALAFGHFL